MRAENAGRLICAVQPGLAGVGMPGDASIRLISVRRSRPEEVQLYEQF